MMGLFSFLINHELMAEFQLIKKDNRRIFFSLSRQLFMLIKLIHLHQQMNNE